jgi:transposase
LSRIEVSSGRRRRWSAEDKGRIVAESFERGVKASDVARRHDMSPQQLFQWRRQARSGAFVVPVADDFPFAEVRIEPSHERLTQVGGDAGLELVLGDATVRVTAATDLGLLSRVVRLLRGGAG